MKDKMAVYREARLRIKAREMAEAEGISFDEALAHIRHKRAELEALMKPIRKRIKARKAGAKAYQNYSPGSVMVGLSRVTGSRMWKKTK